MKEVIIVMVAIYQIGILFTFIGLMLADVPSKQLSGFKSHLAFALRLIIWPYGLSYYMLRDDTQHS